MGGRQFGEATGCAEGGACVFTLAAVDADCLNNGAKGTCTAEGICELLVWPFANRLATTNGVRRQTAPYRTSSPSCSLRTTWPLQRKPCMPPEAGHARASPCFAECCVT